MREQKIFEFTRHALLPRLRKDCFTRAKNELRKGWMPPPSDLANFGKEIYSVTETFKTF